MKAFILAVYVLLGACTSTDPRLKADYYDGYDDGEEHASECIGRDMDLPSPGLHMGTSMGH